VWFGRALPRIPRDRRLSLCFAGVAVTACGLQVLGVEWRATGADADNVIDFICFVCAARLAELTAVAVAFEHLGADFPPGCRVDQSAARCASFAPSHLLLPAFCCLLPVDNLACHAVAGVLL
jgi:hypothetical protein